MYFRRKISGGRGRRSCGSPRPASTSARSSGSSDGRWRRRTISTATIMAGANGAWPAPLVRYAASNTDRSIGSTASSTRWTKSLRAASPACPPAQKALPAIRLAEVVAMPTRVRSGSCPQRVTRSSTPSMPPEREIAQQALMLCAFSQAAPFPSHNANSGAPRGKNGTEKLAPRPQTEGQGTLQGPAGRPRAGAGSGQPKASHPPPWSPMLGLAPTGLPDRPGDFRERRRWLTRRASAPRNGSSFWRARWWRPWR